MNIILTIVWAVLVLVVLALLVWRKAIAVGEDDNLHVMDVNAAAQSAAQSLVAHKLELIDKWGKTLTVVALVYGVALAAVYMAQTWIANSRVGV